TVAEISGRQGEESGAPAAPKPQALLTRQPSRPVRGLPELYGNLHGRRVPVMPAELVSIESAPNVTPSKRAKTYQKESIDAWGALCDALKLAGLVERPHTINPTLPVERLLGRVSDAHYRQISHWQSRAAHLESLLRKALACEQLSDEDRRAISRGLY